MMARERARGTTLAEVAKATATAWHDPDAPAWSADLVMAGLARRVAEGHGQAAPMLRAALACVLGGESPSPLLILDEPTNHLDVEAIEAVEAGLAAYDGALLVVSHDDAFLEAVGVTRRVGLGR